MRLLKSIGNFLVACILACCIYQSAVSGYELFTVGKNKSAKMSTKDPASGDPILGNDGKIVGPPTPGAVILHTANGDMTPWWLVDMQQSYIIHGARVWNRLDPPCAERFSQIRFGVTRTSSVWTSFNKDLFELCYYYTNVPTAADNPINITCTRPVLGRYLSLYKNVTGFPTYSISLHFLEIDILAISKRSSSYMTEIQPSFSASSNSLLSEWSGQKRSQSECLIQCSLLPDCLFALVKSDSRDCWLFGSAIIPTAFSSSYNSDGARFLVISG